MRIKMAIPDVWKPIPGGGSQLLVRLAAKAHVLVACYLI